MNPMFDLLARVVGNNLPKARLLLHRARLFDFPYRAHEVLPQEFDPTQRSFLQEHFCLPFDAIAVEDTASVVAIFDAQENQVGLPGRRYFLEGLPLNENDAAEFRPDDPARRIEGNDFYKDAPPNSMSVTMGWIEDIQLLENGDFLFNGKIEMAIIATPQRVFMDLSKERDRTQEYKKSLELASVHTLPVPVFILKTAPGSPPSPSGSASLSTTRRLFVKGV